MRLIWSLLLGTVLLAGCADEDTVIAVNFEGLPIDDLTATVTSPTTVTLAWSAPSAGNTVAAGYRIRWRVGSLDASTWDDATAIAEPPPPSAPGDPDQLWVLDLPAGQAVAFAVRYTQGAGVSDLSNVAVVELPAAPPAVAGCVYVPAGSFTMGSPSDELGRDADEAAHPVTLTRGFYLGRHEVTQAEYEAVTGLRPSYHRGDDKPVEQVSFLDAITYCNARSLQDGLTPAYTIAGDDVAWDPQADGWRLPPEAEWEYACRAGSTGALAGGPLTVLGCDLDFFLGQFGLYCGNDLTDEDNTGPFVVGQFQHNAWNLLDMHGNVSEWCWDWYVADLGSELAVDPRGPDAGAVRVLRGGAWTSQAQQCRSASRSYLVPSNANRGVGFRVGRTAPW
jgi:formylglycine-generating enzyme required for sulfatase activity